MSAQNPGVEENEYAESFWYEDAYEKKHEAPELAPVATAASRAGGTLEAAVSAAVDVSDVAAEPSDDDRAVARKILGERLARKYPGRALPRWFDRSYGNSCYQNINIVNWCSFIS